MHIQTSTHTYTHTCMHAHTLLVVYCSGIYILSMQLFINLNASKSLLKCNIQSSNFQQWWIVKSTIPTTIKWQIGRCKLRMYVAQFHSYMYYTHAYCGHAPCIMIKYCTYNSTYLIVGINMEKWLLNSYVPQYTP